MELPQRGFSLFWQQTIALLKKNFLLSMRNKRATFLQLFSSLFFLGLLFGIQNGMNYRSKHPTAIRAVNDPQPITNPPIPPCEHKFFIKRPCYDFVWSGSGNKRIESIVLGILANNPGRPIPSTKVKSFGTKDDLNNWLLSDPMRTPGALHFVERNATVISYGVVTNTTSYFQFPRASEDPTFKFQLPLQLAASREIARSLLGDSKFSWNVGLKEFAHPAIEKPEERDSFQVFAFVNIFGPIFFYAVSMFGFIFQISTMVLEKELKLRQAMTVMGLFDSAYWCSWLIWEGIMTFLSSLLIVLFGMMFQLHLFLKNSFLIVLLLFFLFQLNMVGFAFLISNFIRKSASTTSASFAIFVIGCGTQAFSGLLYSDTSHKTRYRRILWSFFPPNPFSGGLDLLLFAAEHGGMSWSRLSSCDTDDSCYSILHYYRWLIATFFLWLVLAIYLDNILPNSAGVRKPFSYFLKPGYWTGRGEEKFKENAPCCGSGSAPANDSFTQDDEDVLDEENRVKQQAKEGNVDPNIAVQLQDLYKMYSRTINFSCHSCCLLCCYCRCKIKKPFKAVQGLWLNLEKDQLFCLLGPNGAGKTTVISCLTGIIPVTRGNALIYGNSVRSSVGISNIRKLIGVCSQFDTLWDALSGQEHLELFATIKGLSRTSKRSEAKKLLADVKLDDVAKVRAGSYSGGMKRRLSLGIALIGDPKLLFLDEPTTGMDPVTRRHIWSVIEAAKQGRSIVLTTHSMEEADILSDRIGIMARGRLRCIGTSTLLKSRFGAGFITKISFSKSANDVNSMENTIVSKHREAVKEFFMQHIDVTPKDEDKSFLTFIIPHEKEKLLENFFAELDNRKTEFGILNIQIGLTTLEEVFLSIAKKAELEVAASEETIKTLILPSGTTLQVPVGSKYVEIPGTISVENPRGLMVEVYWEQDDHGNLCISGHSDETPVPPNLQITLYISNNFLIFSIIHLHLPILLSIETLEFITEDSAKDHSSVFGKAKQSSSKLLRYPLRSTSKSKEEKPPLTDSSNSSASARVRPASSVSKSVAALPLSGKEKSAKPPRRLSVPSKSIASPASRPLGTIAKEPRKIGEPISETRAKRSNQGKSDTPQSNVSKFSNRKKYDLISSASYWLSQIKLSESAAKHSISLGFFKLALEAGSEPLQRLRDELKSYVQRHTLVELEEPVKQLFDSYNIIQNSEQLQVSETCSHVPKDGSRSSDDGVHSSSSVANTERLQTKVLNKDTTKTEQVKEPTKQKPSKIGSTPRTRNSVNKIAATAKSISPKTGGRITKEKLQKPVKPEVNKDKVKRQGKKSAQGEGPVDACIAEKVLEEDKENLDAVQTEVVST